MKKYLSFDIECCDGIHMCEFGYVIFDEEFNLIEKKVILINPEHKFRLKDRPHEDDLELHHSEDEYKNSPLFSEVYSEIKAIIENPEYIIIGFSLKNDEEYLATACKNYRKEPIKFSYYDFQILYKAYTKSANRPSVEKFINDLGIDEIIQHKSEDDAYAVMLGLKAISQKEQKGLSETLAVLLKIKGSFVKEQAITKAKSQKKKALEGYSNAQKSYLRDFIKKLEKNIMIKDNHKVVCIGENFQKFYFNEFLALIELLYKNGNVYTGKASESNIFIQYNYEKDGELLCDKRLQSVLSAIETEQKHIQIVQLEDYLTLLSTSLESLKRRNIMKYEAGSVNRKTSRRIVNSQTTLGDIMKAQGIDLSHLFADTTD